MKNTSLLQSLNRSLLLAGCVGGLFLSSTQTVVAHGTMTAPASRIWRCYQEGPHSSHREILYSIRMPEAASNLIKMHIFSVMSVFN